MSESHRVRKESRRGRGNARGHMNVPRAENKDMIEPSVRQEGRANLWDVDNGSGALISECGKYRYRLWRLWNADQPVMVWVMLNPSTADAATDDPTIRKCIGFAKTHGFGGIIVVNLFAWRATDPKELSTVPDPIGPENDQHILWACRAPLIRQVVAGWGADRFAQKRARAVRVLIQGATGLRLQCFRKSEKTGAPWHPLYLPYASPLMEL